MTKTELIAIGSKSKLKQVSTSSMVFQDCEIEFSKSVQNLGVFLDESFSVEMQVNQLCKFLYFQLRSISKIRSFLTVNATNTLAVAFILSRLDYCNSLLADLPDHKLAKLQCIQNSAARLILRKPRRESTTPSLKILHWLPVKARTEYKVSTLCYQCLNSVAMPSYLCELLQTYKPTRTLRSQDSSLLAVPRFSLNTYGKISLSVYGPATWNSLPVHVRQSQCLVRFKKQLKTYLFMKHLSEWERGWWLGGGGVDWEREGGERKREEEEEEEKGHTINELCIIVLLLVLNLLCFIIFQLERQKRVQANELCIIVLLLVF